MMKKIVFTAVLVLCCLFAPALSAQPLKYVQAKDLTLVGKLFPEDSLRPYHRLDTAAYNAGFTRGERNQMTMASGIAVVFETDSPTIAVCPVYGRIFGASSCGPISQKGFDLYIKEDGKWLWAGAATPSESGVSKNILENKKEGMSQCLIYFPLFSSLDELRIGVREGSVIRASRMPFRHRVAVFGSSFTQGSCTSRPGMAYPAQLSRMTGFQMLSLGCSGNSKLQVYFAHTLADADVDAYIFDAFSNPSSGQIESRLFKFIEIIQEKHPDAPLIFQKTIYREKRNFNTEVDEEEADKQETADRMMLQACRKYKNVYYVKTTDAASSDHETSVDGIHPGDYGYVLWTRSVAKPIKKILAKYGIR